MEKQKQNYNVGRVGFWSVYIREYTLVKDAFIVWNK